MPASKKIELKYSLDPTWGLGDFVVWYENSKRTVDSETGRKRKGPAKTKIKEWLEYAIEYGTIKDEFGKAIKEYKEDTKLPVELQKAKNNLSAEKFETFKKIWEEAEAAAKNND